jgi:hypothetical protein
MGWVVDSHDFFFRASPPGHDCVTIILVQGLGVDAERSYVVGVRLRQKPQHEGEKKRPRHEEPILEIGGKILVKSTSPSSTRKAQPFSAVKHSSNSVPQNLDVEVEQKPKPKTSQSEIAQ